jgi:hypothetical protein
LLISEIQAGISEFIQTVLLKAYAVLALVIGSAQQHPSGTKAGGLNQAYLIAAGREFTTLVTLDHHAAPRLNTNDPCPHPAKGG